MTEKNPLFDVSQTMRDLASAVRDGQKKPRPYNGTPGAYKPSTARFKMKIWYRDGNSRVYYSFDHHQTKNGTRTDEYEGLKKLIRLGHVAHQDAVKVLVIWACIEQIPATEKNHYNYEVLKVTSTGVYENNIVSFRPVGPNVLLDTSAMYFNSGTKLRTKSG